MVMTKRIIKLNDGYVIPLDEPIMKSLGLSEGDELELVLRDGSLVYTPIKKTIDDEIFREAADCVMKQYSKALKDLS